MKGNTLLNQYFTPTWAAELIVKHFYPNLTDQDVVFDMGCGDGRFLMALPDQVEAYGFEIDPLMAQQAKINTGREIIVGDFNEVAFPAKPTLVLGNPPYQLDAVTGILNRVYEELDYDQQTGFLLPVYMFQTADTVMELARKWSLQHTLIPRNVFQNMQQPLMFAQFIKEKMTTMVGMFLYPETSDILSLKKKYRLKFLGNESVTHVWGNVIEEALASLGGQATLQEIYREIEGKKPTKTKFWKEQIRKVLRQYFPRVGKGTYALERNVNLQLAF